MPVHDWKRVNAGTFHHFHTCWVMIARFRLAPASHPQNSRGHRLHAAATSFTIAAVAFWSIHALHAGEIKDDLRKPNVVLVVADDKYE
jgi:hypothetical protein